MDGTPALHGEQIFGIGLRNQDGESLILSIFNNEEMGNEVMLKSAKTANRAFNIIRSVFKVEDELKEFARKIYCISSDSCSEQKAINRAVESELQAISGNDAWIFFNFKILLPNLLSNFLLIKLEVI